MSIIDNIVSSLKGFKNLERRALYSYEFIGKTSDFGIFKIVPGNQYGIELIYKSPLSNYVVVKITDKATLQYVHCPYSSITTFNENWKFVDMIYRE